MTAKAHPASGIFVTPIDFRLLPGTFLQDKPRINIPIDRLDPEWTVLTYVLDEERVSLPYTPDTLKGTAKIWDEDLVRRWFADSAKCTLHLAPSTCYANGFITMTPSYSCPGFRSSDHSVAQPRWKALRTIMAFRKEIL